MDFRAETTLEEKDLRAFAAVLERRRTGIRRVRAVSRTASVACGAAFFLIGAWQIIAALSGAAATRLFIAALFIAAGAFMLASGSAAQLGRSLWKRYPYKGEAVTYEFSQEGFTESVRDIRRSVEYSDVTGVCGDGERYYLLMSHGFSPVLPRADFREGDPAAFGAWAAGLAGVKLEELGNRR